MKISMYTIPDLINRKPVLSVQELWDISYSYLMKLIPVKKKVFIEFKRRTGRYKKISNRRQVKRLKLEILFLQRELKYRNNYPEYRRFCEMYVVGINEKTDSGYKVRYVRGDINFLAHFAGWCEDHGMMVQSRKLMRIIDRINKNFEVPY